MKTLKELENSLNINQQAEIESILTSFAVEEKMKNSSSQEEIDTFVYKLTKMVSERCSESDVNSFVADFIYA